MMAAASSPTSTPRKKVREGPVLPMDIWKLIAQEIASRNDLGHLVVCARLSREMARESLPVLYGIHEQSIAINGDDLDEEAALGKSVGLWRSIIASSLGETLYQYCSWIKALKLGNLYSCLEDLERGSNAALRARFFSHPLQGFYIQRNRTRKQQLDRNAVIVKVSDSIIKYMDETASDESKHVMLGTLEGYHLPTANLENWVSKLSLLASLVVVDGSVLTSGVARVIRENCPKFRDLECYFCQGPSVDEQLAGFFSSLKRDSVESFTIRSRNDLCSKTFEALTISHSRSLRRLTLQDLDRVALLALPRLSSCVDLEKLVLEGGWGASTFQWEDESLREMKEWLKRCKRLKELELTIIAKATEILNEVLRHGDQAISLTSLTLKLVDHKPEFYQSLASQTNLRRLTLKIVDDSILGATDGRRDLFVNALCKMEHLRELDTNELFTSADIEKISRSTHKLEELVLNGDIIRDAFIKELSRMKHLKSINIFGPSSITPASLKLLVKEFERHKDEIDSALHDGLLIWIANQMSEVYFPSSEEFLLTEWVRDSFGGKFDIMYRRDPGESDEPQESDNTDQDL
ncbi:hypothetical protein QBC44DRAFT_73200 [Cladorrhinum sp. PSN332]|nr:hypothetical protein QBC44DRAFT_73200 [Cladorrhinum sp. PSN332]